MAPSLLLPWTLAAVLALVSAALALGRRRARHERDRLRAKLERQGLTFARLSQAVEGASDAIGIGDMESNSLYHNRAHRELFGYGVEELNAVEEPAALFADKAVARRIHESIRAGLSWRGETEIKTRDGRVLPALVRADIIRDERGAPIGIFGVFTDITERRATERALAEERERAARAQRLESLGMLAGGVAHDFGNLLTIIIAQTELLRLQPGTPEPVLLRRTEEISKAAWRAQDLSKNLLAFARGSAPAKRRLVLGPLVAEAARAATRHAAGIELQLDLAPDLAEVEADPVQMDQVIANLAVNAAQAMPAGGRLHVSAANRPAPPSGDSRAPFEGPAVVITLRDSGGGIPAELLPKIWEPFFTTKAKGTGLGLATVYAVVKKHGGAIAVDSQPGVGTTFTISLPAAPGSSPIVPAAAGPAPLR